MQTLEENEHEPGRKSENMQNISGTTACSLNGSVMAPGVYGQFERCLNIIHHLQSNCSIYIKWRQHAQQNNIYTLGQVDLV